jgi:glycosyltransferase involved in cell wall biosynthesis
MIDILLATYNGERYLCAQIDSILNQSYQDFRLLIRDDRSTDGTGAILAGYAQQYPDKVVLLSSDENLGVKGNFSELMEQSAAPYLMFADQDDIWQKEKVEKSLKAIQELENERMQPLLVHTDLQVVNEQLELLDSSFWRYAGLNPALSSLNRLLVQNMVTGCTVIFNRQLLEIALPIPAEALMHDWWLALVASAFGRIESLAEPMMLYRQHGANNLGAQKFSSLSWCWKGMKKVLSKRSRLTEKQATRFLHRYCLRLSPQQQELVLAYGQLSQKSWWQSRRQIIKHRFFRHGLLRTIFVLLC